MIKYYIYQENMINNWKKINNLTSLVNLVNVEQN